MHEISLILEKLENCSDEPRACKLLSDFQIAHQKMGEILLNLDSNVDHEEWKKECDAAKQKVDDIVKQIQLLN